MARQEGVEPPTNRIGTCYSIQLSYWRRLQKPKQYKASAKKPYDTCVAVEVQGPRQGIFYLIARLFWLFTQLLLRNGLLPFRLGL